MKLLERFRQAVPFGLPILASIAAVVLLAEGYSVSNKVADYQRIRAEHELLTATVAQKRRDADEASINHSRVTGELAGANESMRRIAGERETALKEIAEARAARASTDVQRRQFEDQSKTLQAEIEAKTAVLRRTEAGTVAAKEQFAAEQARLAEAENKARAATDSATRLQRLATEAESRLAAIDKANSDTSARLTGTRQELEAAIAELEQRRKDAQGIAGETATLKGQIAQIRREAEIVGRESAELQQRRTALQGEVKSIQSQLTELSAQAVQRTSDIAGLDKKNRDIREQLATAETALQSTRAEEADHRKSVNAQNAELGRLKQETSTLAAREAALASVTSQHAAIQRQITERQRESVAVAEQLNQLTAQLARRRQDAAALDKEIATITARRDALTSELTELERRQATTRNEISNLEQRRQQLFNEMAQQPSRWPMGR